MNVAKTAAWLILVLYSKATNIFSSSFLNFKKSNFWYSIQLCNKDDCWHTPPIKSILTYLVFSFHSTPCQCLLFTALVNTFHLLICISKRRSTLSYFRIHLQFHIPYVICMDDMYVHFNDGLVFFSFFFFFVLVLFFHPNKNTIHSPLSIYRMLYKRFSAKKTN